jgi:FkbM family methyltransferase
MSAGLMSTIRVGKPCGVSYEGDWVQRFPSCTLVEPRLSLWTPERIEKQTSDFFLYKYLPREGDTVVDVGAGTGWETLVFSRRVGKSGRVISIEAHPRTFHCLSKMREKNRLENVTVIQAAVGDREGEVEISDSDGHEANSIIGAGGGGIRVAARTLESILQTLRLSHVDFLKMNIEGAERLALPGLGEMVKKTKNVCIACHDFLADEGGPEEMRTKADVIQYLKENNFAIFLREEGFFQNYVYGLNNNLVVKNTADSGRILRSVSQPTWYMRS